MNSNLMK